MDDAIGSFLDQAGAAGVRQAIIAAQAEWDLTDARGFGPVRRARLLAYAAGRVIAVDLPGDAVDLGAVEERLRRAGLTVSRRSRNLA
jgi:hypothetical protein